MANREQYLRYANAVRTLAKQLHMVVDEALIQKGFNEDRSPRNLLLLATDTDLARWV